MGRNNPQASNIFMNTVICSRVPKMCGNNPLTSNIFMNTFTPGVIYIDVVIQSNSFSCICFSRA